MTDREGEDISIIAHANGGRVLASREVALAMAEMLIKEARGEAYLKTQLPLQAIDGGDLWIIEGSRKGEDYPPGPTGLLEHKFVVKIRKRKLPGPQFCRNVTITTWQRRRCGGPSAPPATRPYIA